MYFHGNIISLFGFAEGTFQDMSANSENYWRLPAAWQAIIKKGKIQVWQVYADSKIPYDIID